MRDRNRPGYVDYTLLKVTALLHLLAGSLILIISGVVLFALPAYTFYVTFLFGLYLFVPGISISFGLVRRRTARSWSRYMIPLWRWMS